MEHSFITKSHDLFGLFDGVKLMSTFNKRLEKQANIDRLRYNYNDYLGDGFEFFVELFLKINAADNRVGVYNYKPIPSNEDKGADGIGVNMKGEKCAVQIKYRSNSETLLTANEDHLSNLILAAGLAGITFDNNDDTNHRHFVFTTAKDLHFHTKSNMFENKVKCFGWNEFKSMVDNNLHFWDKCREIVTTLLNNK